MGFYLLTWRLAVFARHPTPPLAELSLFYRAKKQSRYAERKYHKITNDYPQFGLSVKKFPFTGFVETQIRANAPGCVPTTVLWA
jgi:hypothetical protein